MSDPRYEHKFWPNKKGFCKQIIGDRHCGEEKDAIVHTRFEERKNAEEKELKDCSECAGTGDLYCIQCNDDCEDQYDNYGCPNATCPMCKGAGTL
jgi:hypothetical protein